MGGNSMMSLVLFAGLLLGAEPPVQFHASDRCVGCHNGLTTPSGEDISIGFDWRPTMMANAARDPYWQAGVRRETIDHPESRAAIEQECSICHMPMTRHDAVFSHLASGSTLALDGVSCSLCHQIGKEKLGTRESFVGGFVIEPLASKGVRPEYGPYAVTAGSARIMRTSTAGFQPTEAAHIRQSELCATCHTLYTQALGPLGKVIGELPEQVPYQEWLHSSYRQTQSCQSCHMPAVKEPVAIANVLGVPREGVSRHVFLGGNFFVLGLLNRYRGELGVEALPGELTSGMERTLSHLQSQAARLSIDRTEVRAGRLEVELTVRNLGGHKLPTAYPSRRVWLRLAVRDRNGRTVFESGALEPRGLIQGNDNDADPARFEPHYTEIRSSDQVQIYEAIMAGQDGNVTTGLLHATHYLKDNRLLPQGFDKGTAGKDVAVQGDASRDDDFTGAGDRILYSVSPGQAQGPFQIEAELWYQPISYRWASNLRPYSAEEPQRFVRYYDSMASGSASILVRASATR